MTDRSPGILARNWRALWETRMGSGLLSALRLPKPTPSRKDGPLTVRDLHTAFQQYEQGTVLNSWLSGVDAQALGEFMLAVDELGRDYELRWAWLGLALVLQGERVTGEDIRQAAGRLRQFQEEAPVPSHRTRARSRCTPRTSQASRYLHPDLRAVYRRRLAGEAEIEEDAWDELALQFGLWAAREDNREAAIGFAYFGAMVGGLAVANARKRESPSAVAA